MNRTVSGVASDYEGRINLVYFDTKKTSGKSKARREGVRGIPTVLIFDGHGERVYTLIGAHSRAVVEQHLDTLLAQE